MRAVQGESYWISIYTQYDNNVYTVDTNDIPLKQGSWLSANASVTSPTGVIQFVASVPFCLASAIICLCVFVVTSDVSSTYG